MMGSLVALSTQHSNPLPQHVSLIKNCEAANQGHPSAIPQR